MCLPLSIFLSYNQMLKSKPDNVSDSFRLSFVCKVWAMRDSTLLLLLLPLYCCCFFFFFLPLSCTLLVLPSLSCTGVFRRAGICKVIIQKESCGLYSKVNSNWPGCSTRNWGGEGGEGRGEGGGGCGGDANEGHNLLRRRGKELCLLEGYDTRVLN